MARMIVGFTALALLAACGGGEEGAGGVTAEESRELNEAANMLDSGETLLPADETGLANGQTPVAESGDVLVTDESAVDAPAGNGQ